MYGRCGPRSVHVNLSSPEPADNGRQNEAHGHDGGAETKAGKIGKAGPGVANQKEQGHRDEIRYQNRRFWFIYEYERDGGRQRDDHPDGEDQNAAEDLSSPLRLRSRFRTRDIRYYRALRGGHRAAIRPGQNRPCSSKNFVSS
jgi:hypothetical protein